MELSYISVVIVSMTVVVFCSDKVSLSSASDSHPNYPKVDANNKKQTDASATIDETNKDLSLRNLYYKILADVLQNSDSQSDMQDTGKADQDLRPSKRQFSPWGGKRSQGGLKEDPQTELKRGGFNAWSGKRNFNSWGGKRDFNSWGGKRDFNSWGGKRDFNSWGGKRDFNSWGGKRSPSAMKQDNPSEICDDALGYATDNPDPDMLNDNSDSDMLSDNADSDMLNDNPEDVEEKKNFNSWGGKRNFNSWGGKRNFNSWGGKRNFNSWGGKRNFNAWGGKRNFNSWGGKRNFNSWGGKRNFNSWGGKRGLNSCDKKR